MIKVVCGEDINIMIFKNGIIEYIAKMKLGFKDVAFIPISGLLGDNLVRGSSIMGWYNGGTLMEVLDSIQFDSNNKNEKQSNVISVMDRYEEGNRINIVGRVECGNINKGDKLFVLPSKKVIYIEKIYSDFLPDSVDVTSVNCGEHVIITTKTKDIYIDDVQPGYILCSDTTTIIPTMEFKAEIVMLSNSENLNIITAGAQLIMYLKLYRLVWLLKG